MMEKIQKYGFKEGLPQEFEIIDFDLLFTEFSEEIKKPHRVDFYQIFWFQKGSSTHVVDFKPIKIESNSLLFINKNSVQLFDTKTKFKGKAILFTDNFFCMTRLDTQFLKSTILFNDLLSVAQISVTDTIIGTIYKLLENETKNQKDKYQSDIIRNNLQNLLLYSERERKKQGFVEFEKDKNLEFALIFKDLLENHFIQHKNVGFYATKMNISTKKLNQTTSKIFGKTPKNIIDDRVLLECKRLLVHTNDSVKEIAYSLGFEEPTNFIKYFKKHTGETPSSFSKKYT